MSIAQIESELHRLNADELRRLAMTTWAAFVEKERGQPSVNECDEDDPDLLKALDEAMDRADRVGSRSFDASEVRSRIRNWTTK